MLLFIVVANHTVRLFHRCYPRSRCLRRKPIFEECTDGLLQYHISTFLVRNVPLNKQKFSVTS